MCRRALAVLLLGTLLGSGCTAGMVGATLLASDEAGDAGSPAWTDEADAGARAEPAGGDGAAEEEPAAEPPEPVAPPPPEPPLRIAVISDLNDSYGSTTYSRVVRDAVARIIELDPDLVVCTGDMVAGQQAGLDYRAMWDGFHDNVTDPLTQAGIPLVVTPGNHDASGYSAFEGEREVYVDEWSARRPAVTFRDDSAYPLHYTFSVGNALFASLDATLVARLDAAQHDWLDGELADGADFPVKIVFGHLPIHPITQGRESEVLGDEALEQTMADRGVALYLSGHHHGYFPGRHGGLRQVAQACLGSGSRELVGRDSVSALAFTWIEIDDGVVQSLEAWTAPDFAQPVARASLPDNLGELTRDDL